MTETLEVVDLCLPGLNCPMPVFARQEGPRQDGGRHLLRVVSTDRHSLADLAEFCRQTGHELVSQNTDEAAGEYVTVIRRRED